MMITKTEAQAYFDSRINSDSWEYQPDLQDKALAQANRIVNNLNLVGRKNLETQVDEFPRYPSSTVPERIKFAICEIALALLDGVDPELEASTLGVTKSSLGSASTSLDHSDDYERLLAGVPSATAWNLVGPWLNVGKVIKLVKA